MRRPAARARSGVALSGGDVVWAGAGAATTAIGGFLFAWLVARSLGPSGTGVVTAYATWITALIVVGKVGMDTALVFACARAVSGADPASPRRLLAWSLVPAMVLTGAMATLIWINASWLAPLVLDDSQGIDLELLVRVGCLALPLAVATILILSALRGVGHTRPLVIVDQVVKPVIRLFLAILFLIVGQATATSMVWAWLAAVPLCLVLALGAWTALGRHLFSQAPAVGPGRATALAGSRRDLVHFAMPRMVAQVADVLNASIGVMLLATLGTAAETGLFSAALRLAAGGQLALQAIRLIIAPILAYDLSLGRVDSAQRVYGSAATLIVAASWPVYLLLLAAPTMVLSIFGSDFEAAWPSLVIMTLGWLVLAFLGNMQAAVLMSGGSTRSLIATASGLVVNAVVTVALLNSLGGVAAAIGWTLGVCAEAAVLWVAVRRLGLTPGPVRVRRMATLAAVVLLPAFVALGLLWPSHPVVAVGVAGLGVGIYLVLGRGLIRSAWRTLTAERNAQKGQADV